MFAAIATLKTKQVDKKMSKHPNFNELSAHFEADSDFSITEEQYEQMTGVPLPKGTNYLLNKSALSKIAKKRGFKLILNKRTISFKKLINKEIKNGKQGD